MDVIGFIEGDVAKQKHTKSAGFLIALVLLGVPLGLGLGLRQDFFGLDSLPIILTSGIMLIIAAGFPALFSVRRTYKQRLVSLSLGVGLVLLLSLWRHKLPEAPDYSSTWDIFVTEVERCFLKGLLTGSIVTTILSLGFAKFYPTPNKLQRIGIAAAGGLSGVIMLNIHCPAAYFGHLIVGHWLQAAFVFFAAYFLQHLIFSKVMNRMIGENTTLKAIDKI